MESSIFIVITLDDMAYDQGGSGVRTLRQQLCEMDGIDTVSEIVPTPSEADKGAGVKLLVELTLDSFKKIGEKLITYLSIQSTEVDIKKDEKSYQISIKGRNPREVSLLLNQVFDKLG
jgi:hypothetical protein